MPVKKDPHGNPTRNALILFSILLFSGRSYSLKQLAEILLCSRQSVLRLLEQIELCGYGNIEKIKKDGQNFYQIITAASKPHVTLSNQEIEQLVCCREWLKHLLPQGVHAQLEKTTEKTATLLQDYTEREKALEPIAASSYKGSIDYNEHETCISQIIGAIRKRQVLEIQYQSPKYQDGRTHEVLPLRLTAFHEGLYLRALRVTPNGTPEIVGPITFAVHRIKNTIPTRRYVAENTVLPEFEENQHFGVVHEREPFVVSVFFYGKAATYARERVWGSEQSVEDTPDGVKICFTAQSEMEVVKWVLGFGAQVKLLEPEHLCRQVREELHIALMRYM